MCLSNAKLIATKEDIICYKYLHSYKYPDIKELKSGDIFSATVEGIKIEGKIDIRNDEIHFFTNTFVKSARFNFISLKYGAPYSDIVKELKINGNEIKIIEVYETPYQSASVKMGETYTSKLKKVDSRIYEGLHSMAHKEDVRKAVTSSGVLVECIIPKGSEYYGG